MDFEYLIYTNRLLHMARQLRIAHEYGLDPAIMLNKLEGFIRFKRRLADRKRRLADRR